MGHRYPVPYTLNCRHFYSGNWWISIFQPSHNVIFLESLDSELSSTSWQSSSSCLPEWFFLDVVPRILLQSSNVASFTRKSFTWTQRTLSSQIADEHGSCSCVLHNCPKGHLYSTTTLQFKIWWFLRTALLFNLWDESGSTWENPASQVDESVW